MPAAVMFLNGMSVMILEMVGARLLAPWLGSSIVVWTGLIGVVLACLSLGSHLGGRLADSVLREDEHSRSERSRAARMKKAKGILSALLLAAAATTFASALLQSVLLPALSRSIASLHIAAVSAALLLFSLPCIFCGMVSPYTVRLAITGGDTAGSVIGKLNAVATVGSIAGTFLGGFVLISWFGSMETAMGAAGGFLAAACIASFSPVWPKAVAALLLAAGMAGGYGIRMHASERRPLDVRMETQYSSIRVAEGTLKERPALFLYTDPGSCQSGMFQDNPFEQAFEYTKFYALGPRLKPDARSVLMLGGGGYSVPKYLLSGQSGLTRGDFELDVVELDPGMTEAAARWFHLPVQDKRLRVHHEDARSFLNRRAESEGKYDLIFADVFNSWYTVPFHVGTREAAAHVKRLLADDGVFIMNIITAVEGDNGRLLRSIHRAFSVEFADVHIFPVQNALAGEQVQNVMLLARHVAADMPNAETVSPAVARLLLHEWKTPLADDAEHVPALSDNYAPVERYTLGYKR